MISWGLCAFLLLQALQEHTAFAEYEGCVTVELAIENVTTRTLQPLQRLPSGFGCTDHP